MIAKPGPSPTSLLRHFLHALWGILLYFGAAPLWACAICAPADAQNTVSHQLWAAQAVVMARPARPGAPPAVVVTLKGTAPSSLPATAEPVTASPVTAYSATASPGPQGRGDVQLWVLSSASQAWRLIGTSSTQRLAWWEAFVRWGRATDTPAAQWPNRLKFLASGLEDADPLVAQAAYEEISVAPYAAMRSLRPVLDRDALARWLAAPQLAARRPLYALLLGVAGNDATAQALQAELLAPRPGWPSAELSAMLAALMELRGEAALSWIEQHYLGETTRADSELQAVLLALSVQGSDPSRINRERIVSTYARWVQRQGPRAGWVASDLAAWGRWEFGPQFAAILQSGEPLAFSSRYAMVLYLMRSPRPEARQALQALQEAGRL